jgi:hypothetical protein
MTVEKLLEILNSLDKDTKVFICIGDSHYTIRDQTYVSETEDLSEKCLILDAEI